jgi:hypothetical protein
MSTSQWQDPLQVEPAGNQRCWIRILDNCREPVIGIYTIGSGTFTIGLSQANFNIPAWDVMSWRPYP